MSNRKDLIRRYLLYKEAAKLLHEALKAEGEIEHRENGSVSTHRVGFATAAGAATQDHVEVTDRDALIGYLAGAYPTEIVVRTVHEVRNPEWLTRLLENWAIAGPEDEQGAVADLTTGVVVPGVRWVQGGEYITTGVTGTVTARRHITEAVRRGISGGDWQRFHAIEAGHVDIARPAIGDPLVEPQPLDSEGKSS